jgi:hypothetical protein
MRVIQVLLLALLSFTSLNGCSVRRLAMRQVANALAQSGSTFTSDNDPELVEDALPFSLKLMEVVLAENPEHAGLLLGLASGFTQFGYGFVQQEAERFENADFERARALEIRARNLYLRAKDYGLRGLSARHPGFSDDLRADPDAAAAAAGPDDVPWLYWTAASWAAAINLAKDDPLMVGDLPKVEALIYRALELDEDWNRGAIHTFLIAFEMSRVTEPGDPVERATLHFNRARELSQGNLAGPLVSFAESACVPTEDREGFVRLLQQALAIDPDADPPSRLENLILQRRARWLLDRVDSLFLPPLESLE